MVGTALPLQVCGTELRGFGAPEAKSAALLSVSVAPPRARKAAVVLESVGAPPAPSKQLGALPPVPYPTKSTTVGLASGHAPVRKVVELTSASFALVPDMAMLPMAFGVGRLTV